MNKKIYNLFYTITINLVNIIYPILSFPYASRILGPAGIGQVQFVSTLGLFFALVGGVGIPLYGIREVSKVKGNKILLSKVTSELLILNLIFSIISAVLYLLIIQHDYFSKSYWFFLTGGLIVFFNGFNATWFYQGIEKFKTIAVFSVLIKIISLILLFILVKSETDTIYYLYLTIFSIIGNCILNYIFISKYVKLTVIDLSFKRHFKPIFFIFFYCLATSMYTMLDTVFLGFIKGDIEVGIYSAGVKLTKIIIPFVTAIGLVLLPNSSIAFENKDTENIKNLIKNSFNYIISFSVPACFGLFIFAHEFIIVFSGEKFENATEVMKILALLPLVIGLGYLYGIQILMGSGKDKEILISVILGMILNIILNIVLINLWGYIGASISNIFCEILVTGFYMYFIIKSMRMKLNDIFDFKMLRSSVIASLPFILVNILLRNSSFTPLISLIITIPICFIIYFSLQIYLLKNEYFKSLLVIIYNKIKYVKR